MVIGASVHPQPPYQDLQVVRFLHSVHFFGSIYDTSVTRYDSFVALASKNATAPLLQRNGSTDDDFIHGLLPPCWLVGIVGGY